MIVRVHAFAALFFAGLLLATTGCGSKPAGEGQPTDSKPAAEASETASTEPADGPIALGNLLEPFDPPPLEELIASKEWTDRPVTSGEELLREWFDKQPQAELSVEEALAQTNDSSEANTKIARTLGQPAPNDPEAVDYDQAFVRHVGGDLKSTNPLLQSSITEFEYHDLTGVGLVTNDIVADDFAPAEFVESWQTSEDRMVDKFVLRDDLTWSDGKPVTAHDVAFTFKAIMTEEVIVPAIRQTASELKAVIAYDDQTVVVFHKQALATNEGSIQFPILPKHVYEKTIPEDPTLARSEAHSRLEDDPVVAGPYELVKRARGDEFVLRRREAYYLHDGEQVRPKPYLKEIRVKWIEDFNTALLALKEGDIEEMMLRAEQWVTQTSGDDFYERNTKITATEWTEFHFTWNHKSPFFEDKRVRWAMTYAMDYEELLETICYGMYEQCRGVYHPTSWMYPNPAPEPVEQDLDRAQELLAEAGWEDTDGDGILDKEIDGQRVPFEFTLVTFQSDSGIKTATLMKECLDLLGIVCNVKPTEFTVLTQKARDKEFQAIMGGWGAGKDPFTNENIFGTDADRNYGSYSNAEVDRWFDEGKREFDREKRAEIYGKIHQQMWEDQVYTWLFYRNGFYAFNKKLRGYNLSPWGPYYYSPGVHSIFVPAP